jgi:hypothetical protein
LWKVLKEGIGAEAEEIGDETEGVSDNSNDRGVFCVIMDQGEIPGPRMYGG